MSIPKKKSKKKGQAQVSANPEPEKIVFYLYTKLNENDTKNLRKAETNRQERTILA